MLFKKTKKLDYDLVEPPQLEMFRKITKTELREYYDWYHEVMPDRLEQLTRFITSDPKYNNWQPDYSVESLSVLDSWLCENVGMRKLNLLERLTKYKGRPRWVRSIEISNYTLSEESVSFAFDAGMYFANVLLKNIPGTAWIHCIKTRKSDVSYGQPVVTGFGNIDFNPTNTFTVIARKMVEKKESGQILIKFFEYWKNIVVLNTSS
ncbi:hypothetical protein COY25_01295 [Candidatus Uhrbacteria bacterium CG_4_10_14_0_2_um_filter_41_7]|uniref:Uncharacterized protein n=1 Tax=Candidatus Uhrbacteria bacterium CG_4_9_14_3_um_filter_41_35 TaxID=1975034 RepID=A0A2M7XDD5_9BACT|nr:MAG: hypothetical protein COY25_01295 [Candidatus Uhrbacteria bacterium CG_4_10_14_0_2_um_filter_41_7]PJA45855.1 MAG: hypothetical protein CO173_04360 [Candidatus Uhrbacteria bacterium CG_4_9_14_3_um_filter_41_35]